METGVDGCIDREHWRDKFKIWFDMMSGDGKERRVGRET